MSSTPKNTNVAFTVITTCKTCSIIVQKSAIYHTQLLFEKETLVDFAMAETRDYLTLLILCVDYFGLFDYLCSPALLLYVRLERLVKHILCQRLLALLIYCVCTQATNMISAVRFLF